MLTSLVLLTLCSTPTNHGTIYKMKPAAFAEMVRDDAKTLRFLVSGMAKTAAQVKANSALFKAPADKVYTVDEKQILMSTWGALFSYFSATEGLRQKYWDFVKILPSDPRHPLGFLITHTALTALLSHGLAFTEQTQNNKQLETLFDEGNDEYGIPKGAFAYFKSHAVHLSTSTQLLTGDVWSATVLPAFKLSKTGSDEDLKWAWDEMDKDSATAKQLLKSAGVKLYSGNAKDLVKDQVTDTVFPAQKYFAEWAGDTRVARKGKPLISKEYVETKVLPLMRPGDIVVARQNWFLSNIGLPGFWPHAELYLGTPQQLMAAFDEDPNVQNWTQSLPEKAKNFSELLSMRHAKKWQTYIGGVDFQGHSPIRVLESISEGVSFTAVEHALQADYLGVVRPRLTQVEKAKAIERAFAYQGRPYDFEFDFDSDSTLVCTELVYKAYLPGNDNRGIPFKLVEIAGRRALPANDIIKEFDLGMTRSDYWLDYVTFVDASEKENKIFEGTEESLRDSWKRVKWDVALK